MDRYINEFLLISTRPTSVIDISSSDKLIEKWFLNLCNLVPIGNNIFLFISTPEISYRGRVEVIVSNMNVFWEIWNMSGRRSFSISDTNDISCVKVLKFRKSEYEYEFYTNQKP